MIEIIEIIERIPDNLLILLIACIFALIAIGLWVAIRQGRELSIWPPRLGPLQEWAGRTDPLAHKNEILCSPLEIVSYSSVNWESLLEEATHTFRASGFALVKIVELNSRRLQRKLENNGSFKAEIYLGDPFCSAAKKRVEDEDNNILAPQIIAGVAIQVNDIREKLSQHGMESKLTLKHFAQYPTMTVVIIDDVLYAYFYPFGKLGTDSPIVIFRNYEEHPLAQFFVEHFDALAKKSYELPKEKLERLVKIPADIAECD